MTLQAIFLRIELPSHFFAACCWVQFIVSVSFRTFVKTGKNPAN